MTELSLMREGVNMAYLLTDSEKRQKLMQLLRRWSDLQEIWLQ